MSIDDQHYRPCVGIMVLDRNGLAWMGRRYDKPNDEGAGQWWQMPQGGIDDGESPREAAIRELYEETGITSVEVLAESATWYRYDLPEHLIGRAWGGRYRGQRQRWFAVRFLGADAEIDLGPRDGHTVEFDAWQWVQVSDLVDLVVPFKRDVYAKVVAEFASLARTGAGG
ncbi:MAG: RNA pyrophosphohydrolase [Hyphomicrobiaceae bacterium]|nr:RNA pyrophosphohydrolase [Hyphomicrobiaceae bacterium]